MFGNNDAWSTHRSSFYQQLHNQHRSRQSYRRGAPRGRGNSNEQHNGRSYSNSQYRSFGGVRRNGQRVHPQTDSRNRPQALALPQRILRKEEDWRNCVETKIVAKGLPREADTFDIYSLLSKFGHISKIKIYDDKKYTNADETNEAAVTFCPPPDQAVWESSRILAFNDLDSGRKFSISLHLHDVPSEQFLVESPLNPTVSFPESMSVDLESLSFGVMFKEDQMMIKKTVEAHMLTTNMIHKELLVFFTMETPATNANGAATAPTTHSFKMQIPFKYITTIWEESKDNDASLTISLSNPPAIYAKTHDIASCHVKRGTYWTDNQLWSRQTTFTDPRKTSLEEPLSLRQQHSIINVGRWTTYRIELKKCQYESSFQMMRKALIDHNVAFQAFEGLRIIPNREPQMWEWIDPPADETALSNAILLSQDYHQLVFKVRYQLEACISQGWIDEHNIAKDFLEKLEATEHDYAVALLERVVDNKKRYYQPLDIFNEIHIPRRALRKRPNTKWVYTRVVTVTPTRIVLGSPTLEVSNRVVREYNVWADHFLRVKFSDETGTLFSKDDKSWDQLYRRAEQCLLNGIKVGDRHFRFLASGNSQFREHGAFFFAPVRQSGNITAESIRSGIGDLRESESIAKYASRLGQCFSTTRAIKGTKTKIVEITDVVTADGKYNFTDGVGKMSRFVAETIAQELRLSYTPSLFQFRLGGCKGVFVVWDDARGEDLHLRPSQYKFPAVHEGLEIIRCSEPCGATLNRQIIMVLRSLGVADWVFMVKLAHDVSSLEKAMKDENAALELLRTRIDPSHSTLFIASMILNGFMKVEEPFVVSNLHLWRSWRLKKLKEKAAISIPAGVIAFGCSDESKTLKGHYKRSVALGDQPSEDELRDLPEIFLQTSDPTNRNNSTIIEGLCFVARNPSLHPGDIRVVRAVDKKELRHIKDVVVFPQNGIRDIPSMCSGGDLDGDDFLVVWDPDLLPEEWDEPPMEFASPEKRTLNRDAKLAELAKNFVHHMKFDNVGQIATAHLAQADLLDNEGGLRHPKCLRLAELHSTAVDFPKTGIQAALKGWMRPLQYPHYLPSKGKRRTYHSQTVVGKIYDNVSLIDFDPLLDLPFDPRILNAYKLEPDMLQAASELKSEYDREMRQIMRQHDIKTEFEIWTGFVLEHDGKSNDYKLHEMIGRSKDALCSHFQDLCRERAGGREFATLGRFVAAMYTVTERDRTEALEQARRGQGQVERNDSTLLKLMDHSKRPLISFPWLFAAELGKIANGENTYVTETGLAVQGLVHRHKLKTTEVGQEGHDDIETADGVTHRGETLELFHDAREHQVDVEEYSVAGDLSRKDFIDNSSVTGVGKVPTEGENADAQALDDSGSEEDGEIVQVRLNDGMSPLEKLEKLAMQ